MAAAVSYSYKSSRKERNTAILGFAAVICVAEAFLPQLSAPARLLGATIAILAVYLLVINLLLIVDRRPGLVISDEGVFAPREANDTLAWSHITAVQRPDSGSNLLIFKIDPAFAKSLGRPFVARLSGHRKGMLVWLNMLDGASDAIVADCEQRWRVAHAAASGAPAAIDAQPAAALTLNRPWLTYALLGLLAAIYVCELVFAVTPGSLGSPSVLTLAYLGGEVGNRIWQSGEWWRLFTGPLLHASPIHILANGFVLLIAGTGVERLVGWRWLGAIFCVSALGGALGSLMINAPNVVGVGASGGIMGVLAALFVTGWRLPAGAERVRQQIRAGQTIVPALIPGFSSAGAGMTIDYAAHGGGLIVGALVAFGLLKLWPRDRDTPPFAAAAGLIAAAYFLIAAGAIYPIVMLYPPS